MAQPSCHDTQSQSQLYEPSPTANDLFAPPNDEKQCPQRRTTEMSRKAAKSSKKPAPRNAPGRSSEHRSQNNTASPLHQVEGTERLEHENSGLEPVREEQDGASNGQRLATATTERLIPHQLVPEHGSVAGENVEFVQGARAFVHQDAIPAEYADAKPESRTTFEARAQGV